MIIKYISEKENYARLSTRRLSDNELEVIHYNDDDGFYYYNFVVFGTTEELKIIEDFCKRISDAKKSLDSGLAI